MELVRLYSDRAGEFGPIEFRDGLNVVLAEIRLPENRGRDVHNLGKSLVGRVIDFCLLLGRRPEFFLFKHPDLFAGFTFYLELRLRGGRYLTVRRAVTKASKISLKGHGEPLDCRRLSDADWDHHALPIDRAKHVLDARLGLKSIAPFGYRLATGYLIRSQADYGSAFHLDKFKGKHAKWKPGLARILGFDSNAVTKGYAIEDRIEQLRAELEVHSAKLLPDSARGRIDTHLLIRRADLGKAQALLDGFDFSAIDAQYTDRLVDNLDRDLAVLNTRRYHLQKTLKRTRDAMRETADEFDVERLRRTFEQAGAALSGGLLKDFDNLVSFNRAITSERHEYLAVEEAALSKELDGVRAEIAGLATKRSEALAVIEDVGVFDKYRKISADLAAAQADILFLEGQRKAFGEVKVVEGKIRKETVRLEGVTADIERNVKVASESPDSLFSRIRLHFNEIVETVIGRKALLSVDTNGEGHLDFSIEVLDEQGRPTSASEGHTYQKLICVAFDLAVLRAHRGLGFPTFVFHDGVLETLDPRKKEKLLTVLREYADLGLQPIMTVMSSDLEHAGYPDLKVTPDEVVLTLHDDGATGRLFRMQSF